MGFGSAWPRAVRIEVKRTGKAWVKVRSDVEAGIVGTGWREGLDLMDNCSRRAGD
jgi:hypothetical protein